VHELSVCESLLRVIKENLPSPDCRVTVVRLRIGRLSTIVPDVMRSAFGIAATDTQAEGAELEIEEVPIRVLCSDCGSRTEMDSPPLICNSCGGTNVTLETGDDLLIESFDVEEPED